MMQADHSQRAVGAPRARPRTGLGTLVMGLGLAVAAAAVVGRASRGGPARRPEARQRAISRSRDGTAILSFSVLADSAMEHYRGGFHHRQMYASPTVSALSIAAGLAQPQPRSAARTGYPAVGAVHVASVLTGLVGFGFHLRNVARRPGGLCWNNLFYAAPLGAPGALATAGLIGATTQAMGAAPAHPGREVNQRHGRQLALLSSVALLGQSAEVWLLHFRGAFHNPAMYLPVAIPPIAAAGLLAETVRPDPGRRRAARSLLHVVNALAIVGTGFHIYGVARNMGGWRNWRQNALQGPPAPAPISFLGLGQTGLAALDLIELDGDGR